ncbi:myogenesis-regulating glycosidase isoform X2 [Lycorma delicatula]
MEGAKNNALVSPGPQLSPDAIGGVTANNRSSQSGSHNIVDVGGDKGRLNRRNSISLPNVLEAMEPPEYEPQLTPERVRSDGYDTSDTFSDGGISEDESSRADSESTKVPLRNSRRKSVMPTVHRDRGRDNSVNGSQETIEMPEHSPGNSITSINSISSLLKEKLVMTFPRVLKRRKKPKEYKLQSFVAMLFLTIAFLVGFAHVFYHQQVLQRAYFERIRFNKEERLVRIFNSEGGEIALGYLGTELPETDRVFHCLPQNQKAGSVCMEWMHKSRLYLSYSGQDGLRCYHITWVSLDPDLHPTDCYEDGDNYGHWYGGGRTLGMAWPVELGRVEMSAFITGHVGRHRWGSVLRRYFINSRGVAISVDHETPLYVSINADEKTRLCLQARYDDFAYISSDESPPVLNYSVCTSSNMKQLHSSLSEKSLWDGLKKSDIEVVHTLLTEPVWQIAPLSRSLLSEQAVINYTEDVIALGFLRQGHVLLNEFWQSEVGDFTVDEERFPTMAKTIDVIHRRGFRIALSIQPYICTESSNFASAVKEGLLVTERGRDKGRRIPALTSYKSVASAGMLDVTNNQSAPWIQSQLVELVKKYHFDSFYLDLGTAYDMPFYYQMERNLTNPDHYKRLFTDAILSSVSVIGVSGAIARPPAPVFVSLPSLPSTWESLQVIIPTVLTYGIVGYPFLMPGPVGGDFPPTNSDNLIKGNLSAEFTLPEFEQNIVTGLPNKELYIRWLQLATFLPVIRYSHLPSEYTDETEVLELAKVLTALRQKIINPLLKKYAREALDSGTPLIRPLWMLDPSDSACHLVVDEFSVGEDLIVAPILRPSTHEREVYLPAGVWKDGIDGSLRKGSRWIHNYKVALDKIAYFLKMPNNTRF